MHRNGTQVQIEKKKGKCGIEYSLASASHGPCPHGWGPMLKFNLWAHAENGVPSRQILHFNHWSHLMLCTQCGLITGFVANSKYKIQALFRDFSRTQLAFFQAPKLPTKSHILDGDIQNFNYNVTLKCTVLYSPIP